MNKPFALQAELVQRLERVPAAPVRIVLDTDTYNEIDDQFAVVYALLSPEQIKVEALYAAPFFNHMSTGPADGMELSYEELHRLLGRMGHSSEGFVFRGSRGYLPDAHTPVESEAARDLVRRAKASSVEDPLYVVAIGAITNVASAILMEPAIVERIVVVWLGGHARHWPVQDEFNQVQDVPAARIVFDCGVPLVQIPCYGVASGLNTTTSEMERYVKGCGAIGDFLMERFYGFREEHFAFSKIMWDMTAIAYLVDPDLIPTHLVHSPVLTDQLTLSVNEGRHFIRCAYWVERDRIMGDFFRKLKGHADS
ncbi:MAG: inosine/uridine-preferring nucleoside hydrolase [Paenibacillaceae bacterium]|nr:inosine/uridine-preferring nucleoside hydrolase [Paenibacillaceae bacterium]